MGDPVATPANLGTYLGLSIDAGDERALLVLAMAQDLCEAIVSPLPASARAVVLDVAARAWTNPQQLHDAAIGTARLQYGSTSGDSTIGGLYLSRANKAQLRLLVGRGSAFSADTMPTGTNAVQTLTVSATAGTYTLTFAGHTTAAIAWDATVAQVQSALETLPSIGPGNVAVSGAYALTFVGTLATQPVPPIIASGVDLTGSVSVAQTVIGMLAPGQGLPPWDMDYSADWRTSQYPGVY